MPLSTPEAIRAHLRSDLNLRGLPLAAKQLWLVLAEEALLRGGSVVVPGHFGLCAGLALLADASEADIRPALRLLVDQGLVSRVSELTLEVEGVAPKRRAAASRRNGGLGGRPRKQPFEAAALHPENPSENPRRNLDQNPPETQGPAVHTAKTLEEAGETEKSLRIAKTHEEPTEKPTEKPTGKPERALGVDFCAPNQSTFPARPRAVEDSSFSPPYSPPPRPNFSPQNPKPVAQQAPLMVLPPQGLAKARAAAALAEELAGEIGMDGSRGGWDIAAVRGWLDQGVTAETIRGVVLDIGLRQQERGQTVGSFRYFDRPVREAHEAAARRAQEPRLTTEERLDLQDAWRATGNAAREGWFKIFDDCQDMALLGKVLRMVAPIAKIQAGVDGFSNREAYSAALRRYENSLTAALPEKKPEGVMA